MAREPNRMSREDARRLAEADAMHWSEWEKRGDQILRANGWEWIEDRVITAGMLLPLGVPRSIIGAVLKKVNGVGHQEGQPDRIVRKRFELVALMPDPLVTRVANASMPWAYRFLTNAARDEPLTAVGMIEYKSGGAKTSDDQEEWLEAARLCPGMFRYVAYPSRQDELIELMGGERP